MLACTSPCSTCQGSDTFCLTCSDTLRSADVNSGQCLCNSGYVEILNTCQQCLPPCKQCSINTSKCDNCLDQNMNLVNNQCICKSGYLSQANQCLMCVSICKECQGNQYYCTSCTKNLTLIDGVCVCLDFRISSTGRCYCYTNLNYQVYDDNKCKSICPYYCYTCDGFKCLQCNSGYYLNQINCDYCTINGCSKCQSQLVCETCSVGYYRNSQQTCTKCCQSGCKTCISENCGDCTVCYGSNYLNNGSCFSCQLPCQTCTSDTFCTSCDQYYAEVINGQCFCVSNSINLNGVCTLCKNPCKTCENNTTYCKTCTSSVMLLNDGVCTCPVDTYVPYLDTGCNACTPPCKYCLNSVTYCTDCLDISTLQSDNTCKCPDGYAFVRYQLQCKACTLPCINCFDFQYQCTSCVDQLMYISSNRCYCQAGYVNLSNVCKQCISPCKTCSSNQTNCTSCVDINMDLKSGKCKCKSNYLNKNDICYICTMPCTSCTTEVYLCNSCNDPIMSLNNKICTCQTQQYIDPSYMCQNCVSPCQLCSSLTSCTSCVQGYALIQNSCLPCISPCVNCSVNDQNYCTSCVDINMNLSQGICTCKQTYAQLLNQCQPCINPCVNCLGNQNFCTSCVQGYALIQNSCLPCISPCVYCRVNDQNYCTSCVDINMNLSQGICTCNQTYAQISNQCQPCISPCVNCLANQNFCTSCIQAYALIQNSCLPCLPPCVYCSVNDQNYCTSCVDINMNLSQGICSCKQTYAQISNQCQPCISPCVNCLTNQNSCTSCVQGYALIQNSCLPCISPCQQCTVDDQNYCTSCVDINMNLSQGICSCKQTYAQISNLCLPCINPCVNCLANQNFCTSCIDIHMIIQQGTCLCDSGYYPKTYILCDTCKYPCSTCSSETNCISCIAGLNRTLIGNKCICDFGYYDDGICKQCPFPCLACDSQNDCTICLLVHMNPVLGKCICDQGYFYVNQQCFKCDEHCLTCIDNQFNCVECIDINMDLSTQPKCQCKRGYYQSSPQQCTQCIEPCETCAGIGTHCLSCARQNQFLQDNQCRCLDGYAEVESQCQLCILPCSTCAGPLTLCTSCIDPIQSLTSGTCNCPSNYYFDSQLCQICQLPCITCQGSSTFCLKCNDDLMDLNNQNQCYCKSGYFQNNYKCEKCIDGCQYCSDNSTCILCYYNYMLNQQEICEKCLEPCQTCEISTKNCKSCLNPRLKVLNNTCQCLSQEYFFEDYCYPCSNYCQSCTSTGCTKCFDFNNLLLIDGNCQCQEGYLNNGSGCQICNSYCQTCQSDVNQCTKCFETQNRYLKNSQCICNNGFYDDECTDISGIDRKECNYKNCADGIYTWGEQCDDGNQIPRDGCTNCIIDHGYQCTNQLLSPSTCQTCSLNCADCDEDLKCNKCVEGYYLLDQNCLICQNVCQSCDVFSECITCKYIKINGKCSTCDRKIGYVLDDQSQKCISICGDGIQSDIEQCDDGILLNGDGCDQYCKLEMGFMKVGNAIIFRQPLKPYIKEIQEFQNIYQPNRTFILKYNYQLQNSTIDLLKYINISITNKQQLIDYNIHLVNLSSFGDDGINFTLKIDIELKNSMNKEKLIIQFTKPSQFISFNRIKQTVKEINIVIGQFQLIDQTAKDNQKNIMNFNQNVIYILGGLAFIGILTGGISVFYNILDIIQLVSYLRYINTDFPYNLDEFFQLFKFAQSSYLNEFIPIQNVYDYIYTYIDESQIVDPPAKIAIDGFSTNILLNIQPILQVWIIFFIFYLISLVLYQMVLRYKISHIGQTGYRLKATNFKYFIKELVLRTSLSFKNQFFWSIFLRTFYSTAYDLSFIIILNLASYQKQPSYYINQIGEFVSICLLSVYFIIIFKQMGIFTRKKNISIELNNQFGAVKEGLKFNRYSIYFNTFNLLKKMLLMMALLFLDDIPLLQTTSVLILNSLTVIYLLLFKPLDQQNEFIKQSASEIFITILQIQITGLVIDNQIQILNYDQRSFIGWSAIGAIIIMIITQIILAFSQQLKIYIKLFNKVKNYLRKLRNQNTKDRLKASHSIMSKI